MSDTDLKCKYCKKAASTFVKCEKCSEVYHASCTTRVIGLVVTGKNIVNCCQQESDTLDGIRALLLSSDFGEIFQNLIAGETAKQTKQLKEELNMIRQDIKNLKQSNIDLVRLLTQNNENINKTNKQIISTEKEENHIGENKICSKVNTPTYKEVMQQENTQLRRENIQDSDFKSQQLNSGEFKQVMNKKQKKNNSKIFYGKAELENIEQENGFSAKKPAKKKIWLHISRIKSSVTEEAVQQYVAKKGKTETENVHVKQLIPKNSREDNKMFMVGVDLQLKEQVYSEDFWPEGVRFTRFNFIIGRHFLDQPTNSILGQT